MPKIRIPKPVEFEWDSYNLLKNWIKHHISQKESEEVFFNTPIDLYPDRIHSQSEKRNVAYGHTDNNKKLTIIFTLRAQKIRIISTRPMSHKERRQYEKN